MNKFLRLLVVVLFVVYLAGCVRAGDVLKVGATPVPHAEILEFIKPILAEKGIKLKIVEFNDYVQPNLALAEGELDANYFQHIPYLTTFSKDHRLNLDYIAGVHIEPIGFYSQKINNIKDLRKGAVIAIPNDPTNEGRALLLLQAYGLIKLDPEAGLQATPLDIVENPFELKFHELEAAQLPRALPDVDGAIINTNYALSAGLVPLKDALILENSKSPYVNVLAVRKEDVNNPKLRILAEVLVSEEVKNFILEKYKGAVVPAPSLKSE
ncbi:methionine ABC transporter substrate-binding protein [Anoxybacter fermentans]|uniref:Lipoprotein n=1 Tax=Anoxybacter fermentans TaxID=1323375 RepID=A0A3Q9HPZ0_9FIRM|nr:MetQ/NlpA family ABC transporter substrate-binding protein [Anoxybacter fermentans]AZR72011.1 methionine ABC transporter substrate-binding protein [Anoxybacter fermentans]